MTGRQGPRYRPGGPVEHVERVTCPGAQPGSRDRPWSREEVVAAMRALAREDAEGVWWAPTCSEMGQALTNACSRLFGNQTAAAHAADLRPNTQGHKRPAELRGPKVVKVEPEPRPQPEPTAVGRMLARERKASDARRSRREAKNPPHVPPPVGPSFVGRRRDRSDDFVPPDDLNTSRRTVR